MFLFHRRTNPKPETRRSCFPLIHLSPDKPPEFSFPPSISLQMMAAEYASVKIPTFPFFQRSQLRLRLIGSILAQNGIYPGSPNYKQSAAVFFEYPVDMGKSREQMMYDRGGASESQNKKKSSKHFVKLAGEWRV